MILFRYILREHLSPFLYALFVITFLFIMDFLIEMIDSILSKGLDPGIVLEIFILNMAWIFALSIPMAVLVATLMAYGRLSSDNEIVAMKSAGVHLFRLILPALLAAGIVAGGLIYFNNDVLPEANHRASMLYLDISRKKPAAFIQEGFLIDDFKGYKIIIGSIHPKTGEMKDIRIYQEGTEENTLTFARRGRLEYINGGEVIRFVLLDGESHREDAKNKGNYFRVAFERQEVYIDNVDDSFKRSKEKTRGDREMSAAMMMAEIRRYRGEQEAERRELARSAGADRRPAARVDGAAAEKELDYAWAGPAVHARVLMEEERRLRNIVRRKNTIQSREQAVHRYLVEVHKKYSIPVACVIFVLVGAPLGIMARASGMAMGATYSIAFFLIYWVCLIGGESLADRMVIKPWLAMWGPNLLIGLLGIWLIITEIRETPFLSFEWIVNRRRTFLKRFIFRGRAATGA